MPPRTGKRGAAAGAKRTTRVTRGTNKAQNQVQHEAPDESAKAEVEDAVPMMETKDDLNVEEIKGKPIAAYNPMVVVEKSVVHEKASVIDQPGPSEMEVQAKAEQNGLKSENYVCGWPTCFMGLGSCPSFVKEYGNVEKIELARNMPSAKRKDFGFVTFDTDEAAVTCAKSINNAELGEGDSKAKVRARLSRPLQRGKGRHVGRGDYRPSRGVGRVVRGSWGHPASRGLSGVGS